MKCTRNSLYNVIGENHNQCIIVLSIKSVSTTNIKKRQEKRFNTNGMLGLIISSIALTASYSMFLLFIVIWKILVFTIRSSKRTTLYFQVPPYNLCSLTITCVHHLQLLNPCPSLFLHKMQLISMKVMTFASRLEFHWG